MSTMAAPQAGQSGEMGRDWAGVRSSRIMSPHSRIRPRPPVTFVTGQGGANEATLERAGMEMRLSCRLERFMRDAIPTATEIENMADDQSRARPGGAVIAFR